MTGEKKPPRRPRIEEQKPLAVAKALRTFAETGDLQQTADMAGCHVTTIRRLLTRDVDGFAQVKKLIAQRALELSALAQERAAQTAHELSPMQAYIASKIASQQHLELMGQVPAGVTVTVNLAAMLMEAREALRAIQAADVADGKGAAVTDATDNNLTTTPEPSKP